MFMDEKPISVELPINIECKIETTDAAIKNKLRLHLINLQF